MRLALVVGAYALAAVVCTFPLVLHLADGLAPAPDTLLHSWILAWDVHALTTNPLHLYEANIYYPFPLPLTYSDAMLSGALMVAPVLLLTGNAVLAHNLLTLAALVLAGVGMCLLVRALTGNELGGFVAGCTFAFCASRQAHLEHVNLLQFGWLPLALLCLHRAVVSGRASDLVLLVVFTVCQALASVYLAWMMAIAYAIFIGVELVSRRRAWPVDNMARLAGAFLLAALVVIGVMWPYERMQQIYGFGWPADVIGDFSAVPTDYLAVPAQNVLYAGLLGQFAPARFPTEHLLFPGFAVLFLALGALTRRLLNVDVVRYGLMAVVAFVLSFGPAARFGGEATPIVLPYQLLLQWVPGFGVMRVPARFDFLVMLGLSVVAGFGVARLSAGLSRRTGPLARRSILTAIVGLTLLELLPGPQPSVPISVGADVPPVYTWLRTQDPRAVVAEVPALGPTGFATFGYEYLSTYHWHPLVNGSSGFEPPAAKPVAQQLDAFPAPEAVEDLRSLGVRYLIAHLDALDDARTQQLQAAELTRLGLGIAATFGRDVVYEFSPVGPPTSLAEHVQLELPAQVARGRTPSVTLLVTNDMPRPLFVGAPEAVGAQIQWNHDRPMDDARQDLPVFFPADHNLSLVFPAEPGPALPATDRAQLTVRLNGSIELEATRSVELVDLPTSLERSALSAAIERAHVPPLVQPGATLHIDVLARNTGRAVWLPDPPGTTGTQGVVGLSVRTWTAADGTLSPPSPDSTAHVTWNVNPGQATVLSIVTTAPSTPGRYNLTLDMLSENVTWFEDVHGGAQTVVPVDVADMRRSDSGGRADL